MLRALLDGSMFRPELDGSMRPALLGGGATVIELVGAIVRAEACGSMFRADVYGVPSPMAGAGAGTVVGDGLDVDWGAGAGVVLGGTTGSGFASPDATAMRPPPLRASVSFVITRDFGALRFVRFAAATRGESSAEATVVTSKSPSTILRIVKSYSLSFGRITFHGLH